MAIQPSRLILDAAICCGDKTKVAVEVADWVTDPDTDAEAVGYAEGYADIDAVGYVEGCADTDPDGWAVAVWLALALALTLEESVEFNDILMPIIGAPASSIFGKP